MRASTAFRGDIEGLRGVGLIVVVTAHICVAVLPGGFVGVDLFFVISGFLITGILVGELATTGRIDVLRFYSRRAKRILPPAGAASSVRRAARTRSRWSATRTPRRGCPPCAPSRRSGGGGWSRT
ncbi:hypothetical protein Val02_36460 [Virgisporangium aliadipatigenens]|uniref:Acyltransferase 3 domain-containing protein n=1 Tax=Virgisporangium aliadipatigenens TaxID=741659 RepID=A0A8J3YMQ8_9ACTN|nr:acyltransferase [Virgisporangium aliadipatigenens]GIJ46760.1 hypothetical protein Val02_36460 [Virgisporangium aliadipatigenens]